MNRKFAKPGAITALIFFSTLCFYLLTLQPSLSWGDGVRLQREVITGESFILAELVDRPFAEDPFPFARLGIAAWDHPLYVVLGYALVQFGTTLFPLSNALWWVNFISALFGAASCALLFHIGIRLTGSKPGATAAALMLAVSHTFWWHAATPEVYTLHIFLLLIFVLFFMEFVESGKLKSLYLSVFFIGIALSNHYLVGLAIFPVLVFTIFHFQDLKEKHTFKPQTIFSMGLVFTAAFSLIIIQALRMLRTFPFSELFGPVTGSTFFDNLPAITIGESFLTYLILLLIQFSPLGLALGISGLLAAIRSKTPAALLIPLLYVTYTLFSVLYRVPDQFAFHLTSYVFFALAIPFGWVALSSRLNPAVLRYSAGAIYLLIFTAPFFYANLAAHLPLIGIDEETFDVPQIGTGLRDGLAFYVNPNKRGDDTAYQFGRATLEALPPESIVLAQWYTDTDEYFIFRYFQVVEEIRPDIDIYGWAKEDPFLFDSQLAVDLVEREAGRQAVYLASLSDEYYEVENLTDAFCIFPEHNLYRVIPRLQSPEITTCIP